MKNVTIITQKLQRPGLFNFALIVHFFEGGELIHTLKLPEVTEESLNDLRNFCGRWSDGKVSNINHE